MQTLNIECEQYKMKFDQIKEEKTKLANEIPLLMDKITNLEEEKSKFIQVSLDLRGNILNYRTPSNSRGYSFVETLQSSSEIKVTDYRLTYCTLH
jgi:predicted  nucleic acid-binding Zn-ribbon protein